MDRADGGPPGMWGRLSQSVRKPCAFFCERDMELRRAHAALQTSSSANSPVVVVLHGPDGAGKTQIACRYAQQYQNDYRGVFWVDGASLEGWEAQFAAFAEELLPPVPRLLNRNALFETVQNWFAAHPGWLLIVDDADSLPNVDECLSHLKAGRVLLTTRQQMPQSGRTNVEIGLLDEETGVRLLLYNAGLLDYPQPLTAASRECRRDAKELCSDLNGLPLVLWQAGAFMAQQKIAPDKYLALFRAQAEQHPCLRDEDDFHAITITTTLALETLKRLPVVGNYVEDVAFAAALAGSNLLPNELVLRGKNVTRALDPPQIAGALDISQMREAMCAHGLMRHDTARWSLWTHGLTRAILRACLEPDMQKEHISRFVNAVEAAFPWPTLTNLDVCGRLLPHALVCERYIASSELLLQRPADLLAKLAEYMQLRLLYEDALRLRRAGLRMTRLMYPEEGHAFLRALRFLAGLYREMGRETEAVACRDQADALHVRLQQQPEDAQKTLLPSAEAKEKDVQEVSEAEELHRRAEAHYHQGQFAEAVPLYEQALRLTRRLYETYHSDVAMRLSYLARAYMRLERHEQAEALLEQALNVSRHTIGNDHPTYAVRLVNLAAVYIQSGRPHMAESLLTQAFAINERVHGREHPEVARCFAWQGRMHAAQGDLQAAMKTLQHALHLYKRVLGMGHARTQETRVWLAKVQGELDGQNS